VTGLHGRAAVAPGPSSLAAEAGLDGLSVSVVDASLHQRSQGLGHRRHGTTTLYEQSFMNYRSYYAGCQPSGAENSLCGVDRRRGLDADDQLRLYTERPG
jgi:hypothetical protein